MFRSALPGEVWQLDAVESHCLETAIERIAPFADDEPGPAQHWRPILRVGACRVTPFEDDRAFFEGLVASELARLWELRGKLPCGCNVDEHLAVLRAFRQRELTQPKRFAAARAAFAELPLQVRLFGPEPQWTS
jgi:hypothetical protein